MLSVIGALFITFRYGRKTLFRRSMDTSALLMKHAKISVLIALFVCLCLLLSVFVGDFFSNISPKTNILFIKSKSLIHDLKKIKGSFFK